ncbi:MAG: helix-turn-helix transcriptional regulator [Atopobiaceae bacterium]|nr:helix-turn-helix transcriptional regulator [Atopobiaceae bacterium]
MGRFYADIKLRDNEDMASSEAADSGISTDATTKELNPTTKETTKEMVTTTKETTATTKETTATTKETTATTKEKPSVTQHEILELLVENPSLTAGTLAIKLGLTPDGIRYHLKIMRKQGIIHHEGSTKNGFWVIDKEIPNDGE